jgi:hypothetical protein
MKRFALLLAFIALPSLLLFSCTKLNPTAPSTPLVSGKISFALSAANNIASGKVAIAKGALNQALPITLTNNTGSVQFDNIQVGTWSIAVHLFDSNGSETYSGTSSAVVTNGKTTTVTINIIANTGNLNIVVQLPGSTYTLKPSQSGRVSSVIPDSPAGYVTYFASQAWTWNGTPGTVRSLMQFDFSALPAGATITEAKLYLHHDPANPHSSLTSSNASYLDRVTSPWTANTANWNNQPSVTPVNRVSLPESTSPDQDYTLDVTAMVQDMIANGNYGMRLSLQTETYYAMMYFASGNNADATLQPELVLTLSQ